MVNIGVSLLHVGADFRAFVKFGAKKKSHMHVHVGLLA